MQIADDLLKVHSQPGVAEFHATGEGMLVAYRTVFDKQISTDDELKL